MVADRLWMFLALCATAGAAPLADVQDQLTAKDCSSAKPTARVAIRMWYDQGSADYGDITAAANRAFAEAEGYDFLAENITHFEGRAASWQKVGTLLQALESGRFEHVLWIDADAMFKPHGGPAFRQLLDAHPDKDIIFSQNRPWSTDLNMGVVAFRSTPATVRFLKAVANLAVPSDLTEAERRAVAGYHPKDSIKMKTPQRQFDSVDALCHAFTVERQWEQECVVGMLNSPVFAEFKARTLATSGLTTTLHNPHGAIMCPSTLEEVTSFVNFNGDRYEDPSPIVHWVACEDNLRKAGALALRSAYPAAKSMQPCA